MKEKPQPPQIRLIKETNLDGIGMMTLYFIATIVISVLVLFFAK